MTEDQRIIAEAAIAEQPAATYESIQDEVSHTTRVPFAEVKETLNYLTREFFLKQCATPAHNMIENPIPIGETTQAWYEKGSMWPE